MRYTEKVVREIAEFAHQVTDGQVIVPQFGSDIGNGARVISGNEQIVWLGKTGKREAAAYYAWLAADYGERADTELPDVVKVACDELSTDASWAVREECDRGASKGESLFKMSHSFEQGGYDRR